MNCFEYSGEFLVFTLNRVLRIVSVAQNHSVSSVPKVIITTFKRLKMYLLSWSRI